MADAKKSVENRLLDPYSAKFENVRECEAPGMVIGWVNAKNRLGAFTGPEMFIEYEHMLYFDDEDLTKFEIEEGTAIDDTYMLRLQKACYGEGKPEHRNEYFRRRYPKLYEQAQTD